MNQPNYGNGGSSSGASDATNYITIELVVKSLKLPQTVQDAMHSERAHIVQPDFVTDEAALP
jgi:hypothetical protein